MDCLREKAVLWVSSQRETVLMFWIGRGGDAVEKIDE